MKYERLSYWLWLWEETLKKPKELIVGPSLLNVIRLCIAELERWYETKRDKVVERSANGWEAHWLTLLEKTFDEEKEATALIGSEHNTEISRLNTLLHAGAFDVKEIYEILLDIQESPSLTTLTNHLRDELLREPKVSEARLTAITRMIVRKVLVNHSVRGLEKIPKESLARYGSKTAIRRSLAAFVSNDELNEKLVGMWRSILQAEDVTARIPNFIAHWPAPFYKLFDKKRAKWRYLARPIISRATGGIVEALKESRDTGASENNPFTLLRKNEEAIRRIGSDFINQLINALIRQFIALLTDGTTRKPQISPVLELGMVLGDCLTQQASFVNDEDKRERDRRPSPLDQVSSDALLTATERTLAGLMSAQIDLDGKSSLALEVGNKLIECAATETEQKNVDWVSTSEDELRSLISDCMARLNLQTEIGQIVNTLGAQIAATFPKLLDNFLSNRSKLIDPDAQQFWLEWEDSFSREAFISSHIVKYLSWPDLDASDIMEIFEGFRDTLAEPPAEWQIIFRVKGIIPRGAIWHLREITFYDPQEFDFGGAISSEAKEKEEGDSCWARVLVVANSPEEAKQVALRNLNIGLDLLSFPLIVTESYGGPKLEVEFIDAISPYGRSGWSAGYRNVRADFSSSESAVDGELPEMSRDLEHLYALATRGSVATPAPSQLQLAFILGTHWYRKGRWEPDHLERFLFYWIALEQIFAPDRFGRDKKTPVIKDPPKFYITWRNLEFSYGLRRMREDMVAMVERDDEVSDAADSLPVLNGWRNNHQVVFIQPDNVRILLNIVSDTKPAIKSYVGEYLRFLEGIDSDREKIKEEVQRRRNRESFTLALLYDLRNRVVHDALSYRADIEVCTDVLEEILESVLTQISTFTLSETPEFDSWDELATAAAFPWA